MDKTFCIGDIHGGYLALLQCLNRSEFDYNKDTLICLGDVVDGWPETPQCIEELLKIKHLVYIMGNHDAWVDAWFKSKRMNTPRIWTTQGGEATIQAYENYPDLLVKHEKFFNQAFPFYIDAKNRLYVHGGYNPDKPIEKQMWTDLQWDRELYHAALSWNAPTYEAYNEIYIGHTSTSRISGIPLNKGNVWMLDQGAGYEGKLSIIDVDTHEFRQSEQVNRLYPNAVGR